MPTDAVEKVVPARHCAAEWIVGEPGALVVPMDLATYTKLDNLIRIPPWQRVMSDAELVNGLAGQWQKVNRR